LFFDFQRTPTGARLHPAWGWMFGRYLMVISDLLISGLRVEGSDRRNSGSRQLVVQKMGFATVDR
jgi:hypothetical protein